MTSSYSCSVYDVVVHHLSLVTTLLQNRGYKHPYAVQVGYPAEKWSPPCAVSCWTLKSGIFPSRELQTTDRLPENLPFSIRICSDSE
ncbi:hypothetical protein AVEN_50149-1 [Araneus ventricosus]|uniref:Uncharacterized protein n=1 Tax=Araneus ventricosus TaxID=182803 RepID=A0A4Y2DCF3_ARAVE|nr:hypothetical protein AVEN_50149-1 [Araneus ventricosus]